MTKLDADVVLDGLAQMREVAAQLKRIADRLDSWDRPYVKQGDGGTVHSLSEIAQVWVMERRQ